MQCHKPVLLEESATYLNVHAGDVIVDCTLGLGGHAEVILENIVPHGVLIGIDRDTSALREAQKRLEKYTKNYRVFHSNYARIDEVVASSGYDQVNGILLDLGMSSYQLDGCRGFSFQRDAALDMRMDSDQELSASDIVNTYTKEELKKILKEYGEVKSAGSIAEKIIRKRAKGEIKTTFELLDALHMSPTSRGKTKVHPATRIFQALRIAVNNELAGVEEVLPKAINLLVKGGRICVISFHSLEDRIVKKTFGYFAAKCVCPVDFPVCICEKRQEIKILTRKPVVPGDEEIYGNPRARSARMRVAEKL
ncbi:MAG: 16S rRNA (cytosine(1402)-N(4))-methyltransferase RsmH [Candidatus Ancaeobacter aquaticus]|nr:16S rRNA (cytosine(1402)-N(4))-methyltransferase RsmH [Candidatus Ancaeobacter aquaticus]